MPEPGPTPTRLNDLKLRWRQDPSSRLFLQLADEHRKHGQLPEAVAVLEQGLGHRPNDLSALVALGRCRLDLDQIGEAIEPLETVVGRDPTHIVANKLLVEAHLQNADAAKAGERLEMYRLLNDRDPELDHLEYRLEKLRDETDQEASTVVSEEPFELEEELEADEITVGEDEARDLEEPSAEPATVDFSEVIGGESEAPTEAPAEAEIEVADAVPEMASEEPETEEPMPFAEITGSSAEAGAGRLADPFQLPGDLPSPDFGSLWSPAPAPRPESRVEEPFQGLVGLGTHQHWEQIASEGIFFSPVTPARKVEAVEAEPTDTEPTETQEAAEPDFEPEADGVIAASVPDETVPEEAVPEEIDEVAEEIEVTAESEAEEPAASTPASLITVGTLAAAGVAAIAGTAVVAEESDEPASALEAPDEVEVQPEEADEPSDVAATATLGELYLKQGHSEEAKRIFRSVLEQDPSNQAAREALEKLEGRELKTLTAADLLAVRSSSGKIPEGLTAKKVLVLGNYIQHLRASTRDHVH